MNSTADIWNVLQASKTLEEARQVLVTYATDFLQNLPERPLASGLSARTGPLDVEVYELTTNIKRKLPQQRDKPRILMLLSGKGVLTRFTYNPPFLIGFSQELWGEGEVIQIQSDEIVGVEKFANASRALVLEVSEPHVCHYFDLDKRVIYDGDGTPGESFRLKQDNTITVSDYYWGYDKRYRKVYEEGAELWEDSAVNEVLVHMLTLLPSWIEDVIDLGCGEGRDSIYLAQKGYHVVGVDVSPAALHRAKERAVRADVTVSFLNKDVIYLRDVAPLSFDLAINMGCLHMLDDETHRLAHIKRVYDILRPGGFFVVAHCRAQWLKGFFSVPHYDQVGAVVPGKIIPRRIRTAGGEKLVPLELLRYREATEEDLSDELRTAGFIVDMRTDTVTAAFGNTAVVLALKPGVQGEP